MDFKGNLRGPVSLDGILKNTHIIWHVYCECVDKSSYKMQIIAFSNFSSVSLSFCPSFLLSVGLTARNIATHAGWIFLKFGVCCLFIELCRHILVFC
jgi:hypothetical protein